MNNSRYLKSGAQLKRAEATIPLGSQTFSKSKVVYPVGISPLFAQKAKGSYVWDLRL
jgi:glutamate-1-semialdehyde 2,1-aminomutase